VLLQNSYVSKGLFDNLNPFCKLWVLLNRK
jgi:hypothetical protein